jgi:hypothetical protein
MDFSDEYSKQAHKYTQKKRKFSPFNWIFPGCLAIYIQEYYFLEKGRKQILIILNNRRSKYGQALEITPETIRKMKKNFL